MLVCVINIRLYILSVHSLKEKRRVIKSLIDKMKHKFSLAVAEVGDNELWQNSRLGIALVGNSKTLLEREMERILSFIEQSGAVEIASVSHEIWSYHGV